MSSPTSVWTWALHTAIARWFSQISEYNVWCERVGNLHEGCDVIAAGRTYTPRPTFKRTPNAAWKQPSILRATRVTWFDFVEMVVMCVRASYFAVGIKCDTFIGRPHLFACEPRTTRSHHETSSRPLFCFRRYERITGKWICMRYINNRLHKWQDGFAILVWVSG